MARARPEDDARQSGKNLAEIGSDLLTRLVAVGAGVQFEIVFGLVPAGRACRGHPGFESRRFAPDDFLGSDHGVVDVIHAGADRVFHGDADASFVGGRHQLGSDHRQQQKHSGQQRHRNADGDPAVAQYAVKHIGIAVAQRFEAAGADRQHPFGQRPRLVVMADAFAHEQPRHHRHQRHRRHQRTGQ
ncbi:hypothetical protein SDC9_81175 [bioreactor metagenome]|uniref:Uncharacterized protein n=1 Tax=bioreactor metagenome TaxID=1076179 RepID=A0A644Z206_9ZZZZ